MSGAARARPRCFSVALTGGIASGKTTVANCFGEHGVSIIDADVVARELVAPGQPALAEIVAVFGADMLTAAGELDRARVRERIFADSEARGGLEAILHPRVRAALAAQAQACATPYCLIAIPLLAESTQNYTWIDRVLVVDVSESAQRVRLMQRDSMSADAVQRALAAQATREQRLALADDAIDNSGAAEFLIDIVARLHDLYTKLSANP